MAEDISISIEVWEKKLAAYMAATGKNMREALYEEWPLLMRKIMDFTPPFKAKGARGVTDHSVGRKAVAHDIYKVMRAFDPEQIRSPSLKKIVERRDIAAFNLIAERSKNPYLAGARAVTFSPSLHISARNPRGRVPGRDRNQVVLGSDAVLLRNYVTKIQDRVGFAKSGWLKALLLVGGEAPGFVTRHGTSADDVIDDHANDDNPSITAINRSPWSVRKDEGDRITSDAHASRIESIIRKIQVKERLAAKEAGLAA